MSDFDASKFDSGASYLVGDDPYKQFVRGAKSLGRPADIHDLNGNLFCSPKSEIDRAIGKSNGDINKLEAELGLDKGTFGDGPIHRIDINNPSKHNLREATGNESGANCYFNTPRDEKGNLPNIEFCKESNDKGKSWTARDSAGREIIDADKTEPVELAKLNGKYATNHGEIHEPNTNGYTHTTSGGIYEGVTDQVPNIPENVSHFTISGWSRGEIGNLSIVQNTAAYAKNLDFLELEARKDSAELEKKNFPRNNSEKREQSFSMSEWKNIIERPGNNVRAIGVGRQIDNFAEMYERT